MSKNKLQNQISKKLENLQELINNFEEIQNIDPDDPETWDPDTIYNLVEQLKEALALLENKGLLTLISDWETEQELAEEEDY